MSDRYAEITAAARRVLSRPEISTALPREDACPYPEGQRGALRAAGIPTRTSTDQGMKLARLLGGE